MIKAGKLRNLISIKERPDVLDSIGDINAGDWVEVCKLWAEIQPMQGRELEANRAVYAEVSTRIRTRWFAGITPAMRVEYGSHRFNIFAVINVDFRNREMELLCGEVQ